MRPAALCGMVCTLLRHRRLDRDHTIAVVAGDRETQIADTAVRLGILDGYVAVNDSPAGLLIATGAVCAELDERLNAAIDQLTERLGGGAVAGGAA